MVNFHDPAVIAQDALVVTKLWHTTSGLYIWEFFATLEYEWKVIRGRLPYRWTIWIYSLARMAALLAVILGFVIMDGWRPINCQVVLSLLLVFSFLSTSASSLLIVLRVIAIWNKNKVVMTVAISVWCINVAFLIQGTVRLRSVWGGVACVPLDTEDNAPTLVSMLVTDVALLLIMLGGLFRLHRACGGAFGLTQRMWKQGVVWLCLVTLAEIPPVVFILLNLNVPFNNMFQPPSWIMLVIAATRMHRSLVEFASGSTDVFSAHKDLRVRGHPVAETKQIDAASIPIDLLEVTVQITSEQHWTPRIRDDCSFISANQQIRVNPNGSSRHGADNVERGV